MTLAVLANLQGVQAEVRSAVGVGEAMGWLQQRARRGPSAVPSASDIDKERTCRRFYAALILKDLIDEVSFCSACKIFCF